MNVSLIAVKLNRIINNKFIYVFCHFAQAYAQKTKTQTHAQRFRTIWWILIHARHF